MTAPTPVPSDPAGGRAGLRGRLIEAAAREIHGDWTGHSSLTLEASALHHRYDSAARAVIAAVLPLLADEIMAASEVLVSAHRFPEGDAWRAMGLADAAALLRSLTEERRG